MFDLAGTVHPLRAERALDNALGRRLTTMAALAAVTADLARRGRDGSELMRRLLAERGDDFVAPESGLQARFLALIRATALPVPVAQRGLGGEEWVGRVDCIYRDRRLVFEVDGSAHHSSKLDRAADARRDRELRKAGFEVLRVSAEQVWQRPEEASPWCEGP